MSYFGRASKNKQIYSNQTDAHYNELDINILRERIKLLEIENDKLRKENAILKKNSKPLIDLKDNKKVLSSSPLKLIVPFSNLKLKGCNCKGNCANKICGCMKKDLQCDESCNCNATLCQNKIQEKNKENHVYASHNRKESQETSSIPEFIAKDKQPTESISSVDEVFYDANEPDSQNIIIDAVRKLTFPTDEDTPEKIEEHEQKSENNRVKNNRKVSSSKQVEENIEDQLNNKSRKKIDSVKGNVIDQKKQRKGSKSKRTASVEIETADEIQKELLMSLKVNSRSRKNKGLLSNVEEREKVEKQEAKIVETKEVVLDSFNKKNTKTIELVARKESLSNLKQPKEWNKVKLSTSMEQIEESIKKETSKNTRSKKNQTNSTIVPKASKAIKKEGTSMEGVQSLVRGLRRSFSSGTIVTEVGKKIDKKQTLQKSKSVSKENSIIAPSKRTIRRSLSSDSLPNNPLNNLISRVSQSFRKSKSKDVQEKSQNKRQLQVSTNITLTPVKEDISNSSETMTHNETIEKDLKFDPMQPTRQLSRSPIPLVAVAPSPIPFVGYSPPIYGRFLGSQEMKKASPPPEIMKDLCAEEVDLQTFGAKLIICKKCKRKFFPHRIQLHEAVCQKN